MRQQERRSALPRNFVMWRHAQSRWNAGRARQRAGEKRVWKKSEWRNEDRDFGLTDQGRSEIPLAKPFISQLGFEITHHFRSNLPRVVESTNGLELETVWRSRKNLNERDWGVKARLSIMQGRNLKSAWWRVLQEKPISVRPMGEGESMLDARARFAKFRQKDLEGLGAGSNVLAGSSTDLIQCAWADLAGIGDNDEDWEFIPRIPNLSFVIFTRENPHTLKLQPHFTHVRIINPLKKGTASFGEWQLLFPQ